MAVANEKWLSVDDIRTDGGTQQRVSLPTEVVDEYAEMLKAGGVKTKWPFNTALEVYFDGTDYWLANGHLRLLACKKSMTGRAKCLVKEGSQEDAILASCGANDAHGVRRTSGDKKKAVQTVLKLNEKKPEGSRFTLAKIAKACRVSQAYAGQVAKEYALENGKEYKPKHPGVKKKKATPKKPPPEGVTEELPKNLSSTVKKQIDNLKMTPTWGELEALAEYDKESQKNIVALIADGTYETLAESIAGQTYDEEDAAGVCTHNERATCPRCTEEYCPNCDPEHEGECQTVKLYGELIKTKAQDKAAKDFGRLMRSLTELEVHMKVLDEMAVIKTAIEEAV